MESKKLTRRRFLLRTFGTALGISAAGAFYGFVLEPGWILTSRVKIRIPGLSPALAGKRIVHLTDFHLGPVSPAYVRKCVDRALELEPDLIALTGDYITRHGRNAAREAATILGRLKAPLGVYAVSGNHDFGVYRSGSRPRDPLVMALLEEEGITLLDNRAIPFARDGIRTWLVGLGDLWAGECRVTETMGDLPAEDTRIVLNHNPDAVFDIAAKGADLVLSGHTHGGQVDLPVFGPPLLPVSNRQYYSGLYQVDGRTRLYVSNGLGYLIRVRFNARPEIVMVELSGQD